MKEKEKTAIGNNEKKNARGEGFAAALRRGAERLKEGVRETSGAFWEFASEYFTVPKTGFARGGVFAGAALASAFAALVPALARFPMNAYPAPVAILASAGGTVRQLLKKRGVRGAAALGSALESAVFLGVLAATAFLPHGFFVFLACAALYLVRSGATGGRLNDGVLARVTASAVTSLGLGLVLTALEGFSLSSALGAVTLGLLAPTFTYLLSAFSAYAGASPRTPSAAGRRQLTLYAAAGTALFLFLYAARDLTLAGFSAAAILAGLLTFSFARLKGALFGAGVGVVAGLASSQPAFFAVAGFFAGLFFDFSDWAAILIASVTAGGYALLSGGLTLFGSLAADLALAAVLFYPILRVLPREPVKNERLAAEARGGEARVLAKRELKNMSDAFSSLSEAFYTVSDTMKKPTLTEVTRLVADACSELCSGCALSGVCWGKEAALSNDAAGRAAAKLLADGRVERADLAEPFASKCVKREEFLSLLTRRYDRLSGASAKNNRTTLLAGEYSSVSRLLRSNAVRLDQEARFSPTLESKAKLALKKMGVAFRRVAVFGEREIRVDVFGVAPENLRLSANDVAKGFSEAFGCPMEEPAFLLTDDGAVMRLRRKKAILLECAKSGCAKKGEAVCGDSISFFETDRGYFYTLICDGMGSGREAAFASRLASIFIEKLMCCASPKNVTLEMLNSFLLAKTDEVFTTVDLLEVDLYAATAAFIKAGAAPSYVFREGRVHKIASRTPPAGILPRPFAEQTKIGLQPGDLVLMLSDGAISSEADESALLGFLSGTDYPDAKSLCDAAFDFAKETFRFRDDLSVCVLRAEAPKKN